MLVRNWCAPPSTVVSICVKRTLTVRKDVGCRSNFDPSRPLYTQDTSFSVKSSLTAVRQGAKVPSSDIFDCPVFAEDLVGLGFLQFCFLCKTNPNLTKNYLLWEKGGPNATFKPIFSWVGLALGWDIRRFHTDILSFFQPNRTW